MEILDFALSCRKCDSPAFVAHLHHRIFICWHCMEKLSSNKSYAELVALSKENQRNGGGKQELSLRMRAQHEITA